MFCVYVLSDPRTNEIRYVGKTSKSLDERLKKHLNPYNLRSDTYKNHWIQKLVSEGVIPCIELIESHDSEVDVNAAERFYISYFRFLGFSLVNTTDGGEGHWAPHRDETKVKIGLANKKRAAERGRDVLSQTALVGSIKSRLNDDRMVGAYFDSRRGKWTSRIRVGGKREHLGYFYTQEEAAKAYRAALQSLAQKVGL